MSSRQVILATLGLPESATPADVKRTYIQLVRKHTPESDPTRFIQISQAYRALTSPPTADEAAEDLPQEAYEPVAAAYHAAAESESKLRAKDPHLRALRDLLNRHRGSQALRQHLARLLLDTADGKKEALAFASELVSEAPENREHALLLARCMAVNGDTARAVSLLKALVAKQPGYVPAIWDLARLQREAESDFHASETIDKGLAAVADHPHACALLWGLRCQMDAISKKTLDAGATIKLMATLAMAPNASEEVRAAFHSELVDLAFLLDDPSLARMALESAERIGPVDSGLKALITAAAEESSGGGCWTALLLIAGMIWLAQRCAH